MMTSIFDAIDYTSLPTHVPLHAPCSLQAPWNFTRILQGVSHVYYHILFNATIITSIIFAWSM
jgi:hypothetical protein